MTFLTYHTPDSDGNHHHHLCLESSPPSLFSHFDPGGDLGPDGDDPDPYPYHVPCPYPCPCALCDTGQLATRQPFFEDDSTRGHTANTI